MSNTDYSNAFKSTSIYGNFLNCDSTNGTIQANGIFNRNLTIKNDLYLGMETAQINNIVDSSGNIMYDISGNPQTSTTYTDTGGNIILKLNNQLYTITPNNLIQLNANLATQDFVNQQIGILTNGVSPAYDTLLEISNFITQETTDIQTIFATLSTKANTSITDGLKAQCDAITSSLSTYSTMNYVNMQISNLNSSISNVDLLLTTNYYNSLTTDSKYFTIANAQTLNTNINSVKDSLANNYYTKAQSDSNYPTLTNFTNSVININNVISNLSNNYYTSSTCNSTYATIANFNILQSQIANYNTNTNGNFSNYYTKSQSDSNYPSLTNFNSVSYDLYNKYYTATQCDNKYLSNVILSNYYTSSQSDAKYFINNASSNLITGQLNFNNLCKVYSKTNFLKLITTGSQDITGLFADTSNFGLAIGWNYQASSGKTAFFNCGQGSTGGFQFYSQSVFNYNLPIPSPSLILDMGYNYITCAQPLYTNDIHISSNLIISNGTITNQQLGYLRNISSDVQAQFTSIRSIINKVSGCVNLYADNIINMDLKNLFTDVNYGLSIGWNYTSGGGQTALFNCGQGAAGGFQFFSSPYQSYTTGTTTLILDLKPFSSTFYTPLTLTDNLIVANSTISPVELSYLDGASSNIQQQITNIVDGDITQFDENKFTINYYKATNFSGDLSKYAVRVQTNSSCLMNLVINIPISIYRTGNYSSSSVKTTITEGMPQTYRCLLYINGVYSQDLSTAYDISNQPNLYTPNSIYLLSSGSYSYEIYLCNIVSTININCNVSTTYDIYYVINPDTSYLSTISQTQYLTTSTYGIYVNGSQLTYNNIYLNSVIPNYALPSSYISYFNINNFNSPGVLSVSNLNCNNLYLDTIPLYKTKPISIGVYMISGTCTYTPIFKSMNSFTNVLPSTPTYGALNTTPVYRIDLYQQQPLNDIGYLLLPGWSITAYSSSNFTGTQTINIKNDTNYSKVYLTNGTVSRSILIYFDDVLIDDETPYVNIPIKARSKPKNYLNSIVQIGQILFNHL